MNMTWSMFLILVNITLFVMGQFMEPSSIVMIMTPLLLPIAVALGIDPIHFGIIMQVIFNPCFLVSIRPKFCIISAKSKGKPCKQAPKSQALKSSGLFLS